VYVCSLYHTHAGLTQRQFVARALNQPVCGTNFPAPACNVMFDLGAAFKLVGHLAPGQPVERALTSDELKQHFLDQKKPIGCQVRFPTFGHAVVIADIRIDAAGKLFLVVADPGSGAINTVPYEMFRSNYLNHDGHWVRTYMTQQIIQA